MGGPVCGPPPGGPPGVTGTHGRTDPTVAGFKASFRERKLPSIHPSIRPSIRPSVHPSIHLHRGTIASQHHLIQV